MKTKIVSPNFKKDYAEIMKGSKLNPQEAQSYFNTTKLIKKYTTYNESLKCKTVIM